LGTEDEYVSPFVYDSDKETSSEDGYVSPFVYDNDEETSSEETSSEDGYVSPFVYDNDNSKIPPPRQALPFAVDSRTKILMEEINSAEGALTPDRIINNPTLMTGIRDIMKARYSEDTRNKFTLDEKYDKSMSNEDLFEEWQNWMRSLEGGQTVTTANDVVWFAGATDEQRAIMGASFDLFDAGPSIFSRDTSWSEMGDGIRDYLKAGIWDPTTLAGLGVGRLWTAVGAKTGSMAFRTIAQKIATESLKRGLSKEATDKLVKASLKNSFRKVGYSNLGKAGAITSVDIISSVGTDYMNQNMRIGSGVQTEYSVPQSVGAAMGVILLPSLLVSLKGLGDLTNSAFVKENVPAFAKYKDVFKTLGNQSKEAIEKNVIDQIDLSKVNTSLKSVFARFASDIELKEFLPYLEAREAAEQAVTKADISGNPLTKETFFESVLINNFVVSMKDAGFRYAPREKNDNASKFINDAMKYLDDSTVQSYKDAFSSQFGELPEVLKKIKTGKDLSDWFLNRGSNAGRILQQRSVMSKILGKNAEDITVEDMFGNGLKEVPAGPQRIKYLQSLWKRAVTSHPSTLGLNVKGWAYTHTMGMASDVILSGLLSGKAAGQTLFGNVDGAATSIRMAKGSFLGAARRGLNLMSSDATIEAAEGYLKLHPKVVDDLFAERAGGVDNLNILERLGLDPNAKINQLSEKSINLLQSAMGVKLQDETTKMLSLMGHLDTNIMKHYGMSYNKFISQPDAYAKMFSEEYLEMVLEPSIKEAKRETYSTSWSAVKGDTWMLAMAKHIETVSNAKGSGFLLPFGRFFNTATATLGDITMVNAVRHVARVKTMDDEGLKFVSKGLVGVGLIWGNLPGGSSNFEEAKEKVKLGIPWKLSPLSDGSTRDDTYEFPRGYVELISQMMAHIAIDGKVPPALREEALVVLVSQSFRDTGELYYTLKDLYITALDEGPKTALKKSVEVLGAGFGKIVSGAFRSAEPLNQGVMFATGDYSQPDLRQGTTTQRIINNALRYVNKIIPPMGDVPERQYSTRGRGNSFVDPGRTLGGVRTAAPLTPSERLLGSIGEQAWQAANWGGSSEYKNRLDELVSDILNYESAKAMDEVDGNFFDLPLLSRIELVRRVKEKVRKSALEVLNRSTDVSDKILLLENSISRKNKSHVQEAIRLSGYDGRLEDIKGEIGAKEKLEYILYIIENRNDIIFRDLKK
tara:strand:- start:69 stop:3671 length:3603 start_codon:yes stop_codon:yes gene_type:complete